MAEREEKGTHAVYRWQIWHLGGLAGTDRWNIDEARDRGDTDPTVESEPKDAARFRERANGCYLVDWSVPYGGEIEYTLKIPLR